MPTPEKNDDPLFSGRGAPALMSVKEPALRLLVEKYAERFAITRGEGERVHLFVIKASLWGLVRTFVPKDLSPDTAAISVTDTLSLIESALNGKNTKILQSLDASVSRTLSRIQAKTEELAPGKRQ